MSFDQVWMIIFPFKVLGKFGKIIHLDIISCVIGSNISSGSAPAIIISCSIVYLVFLFLFDGELKEILRESELLIYLFLAQTKVLDVEESDVVNGMFELFGQAFFASWSVVILKIESDQLSPGQIGFCFWWMCVGFEILKGVLFEVHGGSLNCGGFCRSSSHFVSL